MLGLVGFDVETFGCAGRNEMRRNLIKLFFRNCELVGFLGVSFDEAGFTILNRDIQDV